MAVTFFSKKDFENQTRWLWIIDEGSSTLIGWDYHIDGPQVYSYQKFKGRMAPSKKHFEQANPEQVIEVLNKLTERVELIKGCLYPVGS